MTAHTINAAQEGIIEIVLDLLDSANTIISNSVDNIVDRVNQVIVFKDVEFEEGQGVLTSLKPILGGEYMSSVTITNSNVVVNVVTTPRQMDESSAYYYIDAGIRAKDFDITLGDHNFIEIHTKNASALVSSYDKAYETPGAFTPSHLTFLSSMTVEGAYAIGEDSYQGYDIDLKRSYTVLCEALFTSVECASYQTDIIVTK